MRSVLHILAAPRLTLVGMALLGVAVVVIYVKPVAPAWWLLVALALLAINLASALFTHDRLRRGGLLVFHLALLGLILLVGAGQLMRFDGRVEVTEGSSFTAADVVALHRGALRPFRLPQVHFIQGRFSVNYVAGLNRSVTRDDVYVRDAKGHWVAAQIGDDKPLVMQGYRFYTTSNKGFAPLITWTPEGGQPRSGTLNMPSYPLYDWEQQNRWTPPGGTPLLFKLHIKTAHSLTSSWVFNGKSSDTTLKVISGTTRYELRPGETVRLPKGSLRFDELRTWMGYSIFYDPTLQWLFAIAVTGVGGLAWHYWSKSETSRPVTFTVPPNTRSVTLC